MKCLGYALPRCLLLRRLNFLVFVSCISLVTSACLNQDLALLNEQSQLESLAISFAPELGKGVDSLETKTFAKCLVFGSLVKNPVGFNSHLYDEYSIHSRQELNHKLHISPFVGARDLWGSVSVGSSYFKSLDISEDAFYWLVQARYELEHESIDTTSPAFALSAHAQNLLQEQGIEGFTKACGSHFYSGRTLGARYNVLYEFKSKDDKFIENLEMTDKLSGAFGIDAELQFDKAIAVARRFAYLTIHSYIEGGGELVADYAENAASLKAELSRLRDDLLRRRQGRALIWETSSYDIFPEVQAAQQKAESLDLMDEVKQDALSFFYTQYVFNTDRISHLQSLLAKTFGPEPYYYFNENNFRKIGFMIYQHEKQNIDIAKRASKCLQDNVDFCSSENIDPLLFDEPMPDRDYSGLGNWELSLVSTPGSTASLDLYGNPGSGYKSMMFKSNYHLFEGMSFVQTIVRQDDGKNWAWVLGFADMYTEENGLNRPRICVDDYEKVCHMRIVEDMGHLKPDGYPAPKLILTVFDENGVQVKKSVFRPKD